MLGLSIASAATLQVELIPFFNAAPLAFDSLTNKTATGQTISVTRLDFLLSSAALERADGSWVGLTNWVAYLSAREGRTQFALPDVPAGAYSRLSFHVGLPPDLNHSDPAQYSPDHPLNPNVNGLHWGWQGGYVFLALEGGWLRDDGQQGGFSYHLTTERHLMTIEFPLSLVLTNDRQIQISLDAAKIFASPNKIELGDATATTHSRTNDALAFELHQNVEHAFAARIIPASTPVVLADGPAKVSGLLVAATATPYRLIFSRFFPRPALPADNPLTEEGVELGRRLFFDKRLSLNNSQSCASCHDLRAAGADRGRALSLGAEGKAGTRNAMSLFNLAWKSAFFWDGRAATLRQQVLQPIQNPVEMHESLTNVARKLDADTLANDESCLNISKTNQSEPPTPKMPKGANGPLSPTLSPSEGEREKAGKADFRSVW